LLHIGGDKLCMLTIAYWNSAGDQVPKVLISLGIIFANLYSAKAIIISHITSIMLNFENTLLTVTNFMYIKGIGSLHILFFISFNN